MVTLASTSVNFGEQKISEPVEDSDHTCRPTGTPAETQLLGFNICLDIHNRQARFNMVQCEFWSSLVWMHIHTRRMARSFF